MKLWITLALVASITSVAEAQQVLTPPSSNYTFAWEAPTTGDPVTDYQWQVQPGAAWASRGLSTSVVLPTLANGSYTAEARGCNTAGCGPSTVLMFQVGTTAPPPVAPGAPSNLRLTANPVQGNVAAYRSHAQSTYTSRTGSTTVPAPVGVVAGDVLLLVFVDGRSPAPVSTIAAPAGFSPLPGTPSSVVEGSYQVDLRAFYKVASAAEPTSYVVTHDGAALATQALVVAVSGGAGVPTLTVKKGVGTTGTATSVTTSVANTLVLFVEQNWELYGAASVPGGTTPTFTERSDLNTSLLYLATGTMGAPGSTGNTSHGNQNVGSTQPWQALLLAVAP